MSFDLDLYYAKQIQCVHINLFVKVDATIKVGLGAGSHDAKDLVRQVERVERCAPLRRFVIMERDLALGLAVSAEAVQVNVLTHLHPTPHSNLNITLIRPVSGRAWV